MRRFISSEMLARKQPRHAGKGCVECSCECGTRTHQITADSLDSSSAESTISDRRTHIAGSPGFSEPSSSEFAGSYHTSCSSACATGKIVGNVRHRNCCHRHRSRECSSTRPRGDGTRKAGNSHESQSVSGCSCCCVSSASSSFGGNDGATVPRLGDSCSRSLSPSSPHVSASLSASRPTDSGSVDCFSASPSLSPVAGMAPASQALSSSSSSSSSSSVSSEVNSPSSATSLTGSCPTISLVLKSGVYSALPAASAGATDAPSVATDMAKAARSSSDEADVAVQGSASVSPRLVVGVTADSVSGAQSDAPAASSAAEGGGFQRSESKNGSRQQQQQHLARIAASTAAEIHAQYLMKTRPLAAVDSVIREQDSKFKDLVTQTSYVSVYAFDDMTNQWSRANMEGFLFLIRLDQHHPKFRLIVLNQRHQQNLTDTIDETWDLTTETNYIFYRFKGKLTEKATTRGLWFYDDNEKQRIAGHLDAMIKQAKDTAALTTAAAIRNPARCQIVAAHRGGASLTESAVAIGGNTRALSAHGNSKDPGNSSGHSATGSSTCRTDDAGLTKPLPPDNTPIATVATIEATQRMVAANANTNTTTQENAAEDNRTEIITSPASLSPTTEKEWPATRERAATPNGVVKRAQQHRRHHHHHHRLSGVDDGVPINQLAASSCEKCKKSLPKESSVHKNPLITSSASGGCTTGTTVAPTTDGAASGSSHGHCRRPHHRPHTRSMDSVRQATGTSQAAAVHHVLGTTGPFSGQRSSGRGHLHRNGHRTIVTGRRHRQLPDLHSPCTRDSHVSLESTFADPGFDDGNYAQPNQPDSSSQADSKCSCDCHRVSKHMQRSTEMPRRYHADGIDEVTPAMAVSLLKRLLQPIR